MTCIDEYTLEKRLGQGAMGTVHLVTRKRDGRQLALKRVNFADLSHEERKQTLLEVALLSRLRHPNIIEYVEHFHDGDDLCIVMEVAPDDVLKVVRRAKAAGMPLPEEQLLSILSQVASALHYAHSCRVLHRDVKPANVLLTADGTPKLSDFGISCTVMQHELSLGRALVKRADGVRETEFEAAADIRVELKGTPAYMAPELFNHKMEMNTTYSAASDVWALGVMMFELMLFRLPYEGASMMSIVYKLVNNPSQNALTDARGAHGRGHTQYSQAMYACVEAMLHKRPQQRATLPELLSRQVLLHHARGGGAPKRFIDLLEEGAAQMSGRLPDVYSFGRGGTRPRLRDDLMGLQIRQVACGAAHCAVVAVSGEVFTWGRNECGQLGHGDRKQLSLRRRVLFAEEVEGAVVVRGVACGFAHTIAIAQHGRRLYAWGSDKHGQLGLGSGAFCRADVGLQVAIHEGELSIEGVWRPIHWGTLQPTDVARARVIAVEEGFGGAVTLSALSEEGESTEIEIEIGNPRLMGLRDPMDCVLTPTALRTVLDDVAEAWAVVACGDRHSAAITTAGSAYAWGSADDGRLGVLLVPGESRVLAPRKLPLSLRVPETARELEGHLEGHLAMVDCGDEFTCYVDEAGRLWGCGANYDGQLGIDDPDVGEVGTPMRLIPWGPTDPDDVGIDFIACGATHVAAADTLGRLWLWGGRFGMPPTKVRLPGRYEDPADENALGSPCALVACGADLVFTVTDDGDAFTWGEGSHGRLGLDDGAQSHEAPQSLASLSAPPVRVLMVACSKSVASADEGPAVLVLGEPHESGALHDQFKRFLLADNDQRWDGRPALDSIL